MRVITYTAQENLPSGINYPNYQFPTYQYPRYYGFAEAAGVKWGGLADMGVALAKTGLQMNEISTKIQVEKKRIDDILERNTLINGATQRAHGMLLESQKLDQDNIVPDFAERFKELRDETLRSAKSPDVQRIITADLDDLQTRFMLQAQTIADQKYTSAKKAELDANLLDVLDQVRNNNDPVERARLRARGTGMIEALNGSLLFGEEAQNKLERFEKDFGVSVVQSDMIMDPRKTVEDLKAGRYDAILKLSAADKKALIRQCEVQLREQEEAERVETVKILREQIGQKYGDPSLGIVNTEKAMNEVAGMTKLDPRVQDDLMGWFGRLAQIQDYRMRKMYEDTFNTVLPQWQEGKISISEIIQNQRISDADKKWFYQDNQERQRAVVTRQTDPKIAAMLFDKIVDEIQANGNPVKIRSEIQKYQGSLSNDMYMHLTMMTVKDYDQVTKEPEFVAAKNYMKSALGFAGGELLGAFRGEPGLGEELFARSMVQLSNEVKRDNLRGEAVLDRAKKIVLPKVLEYWQRLGMEELAAKMGVNIKPGEPSPIKTQEPPSVRFRGKAPAVVSSELNAARAFEDPWVKSGGAIWDKRGEKKYVYQDGEWWELK